MDQFINLHVLQNDRKPVLIASPPAANWCMSGIHTADVIAAHFKRIEGIKLCKKYANKNYEIMKQLRNLQNHVKIT